MEEYKPFGLDSSLYLWLTSSGKGNDKMPELTPKRTRSPNYPAIDLPAAIERASIVYNKEGRSVVPDDAVLENWGYKARSGTALSSLAALKHFGLLEGVGKGTVRLSDLAMTILLHDIGSTERSDAIVDAAVLPALHREIIDKYPTGLPSDANLRVYLVRDRTFSDSGANDLIREIRATFEYAGITFEDKTELGGPRDKEKVSPNPLGENLSSVYKGTPPGFTDSTMTTIPVLLPGSEPVTVTGRFPISEPAWNQLLAVLIAMKPGLVINEVPTPTTVNKDGTLSGGKDGEKIDELFENQ